MSARRNAPGWAAVLVLLGAGASAQAQTAAGWTGYAPSYAWSNAAPAVTYAPAAPTYYVQAAPGSGWIGYAPNQGWVTYNPGTTWRYIDPNAGQVPVIASPSYRRPNRVYGFRGTTTGSYREYGSGRSLPLAKPWLPGSP